MGQKSAPEGGRQATLPLMLDACQALADQIMRIEYRQHSAAWLKLVSVASLVATSESAKIAQAAAQERPREQTRLALAQAFFSEYFYYITPEDSPYSQVNTGPWLPLDQGAMERALDAIIGASQGRIRQDAEEAAAEQVEAAAGGYEAPAPMWGGSFSDYAAMRRWFARELWPGGGVSWWGLAPEQKVPALVAVDDLLVAAIWIW